MTVKQNAKCVNFGFPRLAVCIMYPEGLWLKTRIYDNVSKRFMLISCYTRMFFFVFCRRVTIFKDTQQLVKTETER